VCERISSAGVSAEAGGEPSTGRIEKIAAPLTPLRNGSTQLREEMSENAILLIFGLSGSVH